MSMVTHPRPTRRILALCVSLCLVLGSILPAVAAGCEGEGEEFPVQGALVFQNAEKPLKVKLTGGLTTTIEYLEHITGPKLTGKLEVSYPAGFEEEAGVKNPCLNAQLKNTGTCEVAVKCPKQKDKEKNGSLIIKAPAGEKVTQAERVLECVA